MSVTKHQIDIDEYSSRHAKPRPECSFPDQGFSGKIFRFPRLSAAGDRYRQAASGPAVRHDLDGNAADEVTDEHRAHASKLIGERFKKDAERRKAQREAELQARQRTEKLGQLIEKFGRTN
jgi:ProP effector